MTADPPLERVAFFPGVDVDRVVHTEDAGAALRERVDLIEMSAERVRAFAIGVHDDRVRVVEGGRILRPASVVVGSGDHAIFETSESPREKSDPRVEFVLTRRVRGASGNQDELLSPPSSGKRRSSTFRNCTVVGGPA